MSTQAALADLTHLIEGMSEEQLREVDALISSQAGKVWQPEPGPQLDAYLSLADLLLYGGAAGGGKTDLLSGLGLTAHERSVIFRRQSNDLDGFWERLMEIGQPIIDSCDSVKKRLKTTDGRLVEGGHLEKPNSELSWQGRPHDFIGFDEGAQLSAYKVSFVMGWLRSASGHRCRAVIASNPPIGGEGLWLVEWFGPWLDPMHRLYPTPQGQLLWAYMHGSGDRIETKWVDEADLQVDEATGGRFVIVDGERKNCLSRTFIQSKLDDNPYLRDTNYRAQLDALPEPLRTQLKEGDFFAGQQDHDMQVIPTEWVKAAQLRWREAKAKQDNIPVMVALSADVAMGGADNTVIASLHEGAWFNDLEVIPGTECTTGPDLAARIVKLRRNGADISVDMTGGWGASVRDHLENQMKIPCAALIASAGSGGHAKHSNLGFANARAEWWWRMREALDPESGENVKLPPDQRLLAELTSPHWKLRGTDILVESKDDIRKRLGSSTDRADAVIQAWARRVHAAITKRMQDGKLWTEAEDDWNPYD